TFAHDELRVEANALERVRSDLASRGMLQSGEFGTALARARDDSARRWRDFKRARDREIEEIQEAEGATGRIWRAIAKKPWPVNPGANELRQLTLAWDDADVRRDAVEQELAPQRRAAQERAVWFFPEEKIWDVDQAATYRGQVGNTGPDLALEVTA